MNARNLSHIVEIVNETKSFWKRDDKPWFRGQASANPPLPKLFRGSKSRENLKRESQLLADYKRRTVVLSSQRFNSAIDYMIVAQHYGLPTRLLDWTESLFCALYFALFEQARSKASNATLWIINPKELNSFTTDLDGGSVRNLKEVYPYDSYYGKINLEYAMRAKPSVENPEEVGLFGGIYHTYAQYEGEVQRDIRFPLVTKYPLAIVPPYLDLRMVMQKSVFTVHGHDTHDFGHMYDETFESNHGLTKIVFDRDSAGTIRRELNTIGVSDSMFFPDIQGLTKEYL